MCGKQLVAFVANNGECCVGGGGEVKLYGMLLCIAGGSKCLQYNLMRKMVIDVNILDTSGESDIDIGTFLVMEGVADWSEEGKYMYGVDGGGG